MSLELPSEDTRNFMDVLDTENSNDSTDKIKEKVRVVSLEDPSIIASDFAANSNSSVWSLCGLNSDDHHVDLGDISPSISPIFTEQQMADHLRDRLMADDHIFSGEHASESTLSDNSRSLPDLQSDLELFDREMEDLESLDSSSDFKSRKDGDSVKNDENLASKHSPRKRAATDTSSEKEAGIALRTRNRRRGQQTTEVNDHKQASEKNEVSKGVNKDQKVLNQSIQRFVTYGFCLRFSASSPPVRITFTYGYKCCEPRTFTLYLLPSDHGIECHKTVRVFVCEAYTNNCIIVSQGFKEIK